MKKKNQPYLILLFIGFVFLASCHEPQQKTEPESNPKVIRQKIALAAHAQPATTKQAQSTSLTVNHAKSKLSSKEIADNNAKSKLESKENKEKSNPAKNQDKLDVKSRPNTKTDQNPQMAKEATKPNTDQSDKSMPPSETEMELLLQKLAPKPFKYRPQGRVDPFLPLIAKKKKSTPTRSTDTVHKVLRKKRTRILTLLEKYDLSQLKLTAVLRTSKNAVAIVEETSGRGFVVKTGTRIGLNSGRVVDILMDRIIIQEFEEVIAGKKLYVTREMKLNKPDSEF